jgi:predicted PurR-regulated permease PerM
MKNIKTIAYISVIVLTALVFGGIVWFSASYFLSINAQLNQNTQNIQSIIQYLNQKTQTAPAPSTK